MLISLSNFKSLMHLELKFENFTFAIIKYIINASSDWRFQRQDSMCQELIDLSQVYVFIIFILCLRVGLKTAYCFA